MTAPIPIADRVAGVILAAGASTRFGSPKQLARVGERTMLDAVIDVAARAGLDPVLAVVPPGIPVDPRAVPVINAESGRGLSHSLQLGIGAVPPEASAAVLLLGDQPTIEVARIRRVLEARGGRLVVATFAEGVIGPPVLLERSAFGLVEKLGGDIGLREVIRSSADITLVEVPDHLVDIDTAEDLARLVLPSPDQLRDQRERLRGWLLDSRIEADHGEWPLPVVITHLARWDEVAAAELRKHFSGQPVTYYEDYEEWNRRWAAEDADVTQNEALDRWDRAFGEVLEIVRETPTDRWDPTARHLLNGCTFHHHADHLPDEG